MNLSHAIINRWAPALLILCGLTFASCQSSDSSDSAAAGETTTATSETAAQPAAATNADNTSPIGSRPATVTPKAVQAPLTLGVSNATVKSGEPVCLDVQVADFNQLLSMQYSVRWDPAILQYRSLQNFQLPGLGSQNFGDNRTDQGILTALWIDNNLQGVSLPDGAGIYQICFQVVGAAGQTTEVQLSDGPTPFEVVNLKNELVDLQGVAGRVRVN